MTLRDLIEKRDKTVARMRAINDKPEGEGGDLSEAQTKEFDELRADLEKTDAAISRQRLLDEADRTAAGEPLNGGSDATFEAECRSFSVLRAMALQVPGLNVDAGREREISQELSTRSGISPKGILVPIAVFHEPLEKRVVTTAAPVGGPGSNLVATDHLGAQFIDRLRASLRVRALGATVLNGLTGNVEIPRLKTSSTVGWVAENAALSESDAEYDKVSLAPKHAGALMEYSRNMLQQTSPDIENLTRRDFAAILAEAVDSVAIQGGGTNEPDGILATAGITEIEAGAPDGGPVSTTLTADLIGAVDDANVDGNRAFLSSTKVRTAAMKLLDGDNRPLGLSTIFHNEPQSYTTQVPTNLTKGAGTDLSAIIYGDWSELLIGYWSQFDLLVNPFESVAYKKGNIMIRAMLTCDLSFRHLASFAFANDVST